MLAALVDLFVTVHGGVGAFGTATGQNLSALGAATGAFALEVYNFVR